jgi:DNA-binding response OmpR family regulator
MSYKILLVEDDNGIREIITDYFNAKSGETFDIDIACTGSEGQEKCTENEYDLVLLDIMLPEVNGFTICKDPHRYTLYVDEQEIMLAPKEFTILKLLMENSGRIVSRESLLLRFWGYDFDGNDRVVNNHIKKLRKALGEASKVIKTVRKQGYKLEV